MLLTAPLLARAGRAGLGESGGDFPGRRSVTTHRRALAALGAAPDAPEPRALIAPAGLAGASLYLDEASVTGTENAIMAASLALGTTVIDNAACEPHVQDLCRLIVAMGGDIEGIGTNRLVIHGVPRLPGAPHARWSEPGQARGADAPAMR